MGPPVSGAEALQSSRLHGWSGVAHLAATSRSDATLRVPMESHADCRELRCQHVMHFAIHDDVASLTGAIGRT